METISLRLEEEFAKELSKVISKNMYSTKTEFIREAIRDKIKQIRREELLNRVDLLSKSSKRKTSDEDLHESGERLAKAYKKKYGFK
jgi:metal-responsive CopG/Arc/MetJ family transcriptional regulator